MAKKPYTEKPGFDFPGPPPAEALEFFRAKKLKPGFDHRDTWKEEHQAAFTVAKAMQVDILGDIRSALDDALANGKTFEQFQKELQPILAAKGWWGIGTEFDPVTGQPREVQLGSPRRLRTIYETNVRQARSAGREERLQRTKATHPYAIYEVGPSENHRADHLSWHGVCLPIDDPWWDTHTPMNGWGCKCTKRAISKAVFDRLQRAGIPDPTAPQIVNAKGLPTGHRERRTIKIQTTAPKVKYRDWLNKRTGEIVKVPKGIDPGFDYNPGSAGRQAALDEQLRTKQRAFEAEKPAPQTDIERVVTREDAIAKGDGILKSLLETKPSSVDGAASFEEAFRQVDESDSRLTALATEFHSTLLARLAKHRPTGTPAKTVQKSGKGVAAIRRASTRYPDDWTQAADAFGPLNVKFGDSRGFAWTAEAQGATRLPGFGVVRVVPGEGFIYTDASYTAEHEFAHRLQSALPQLDKFFQDEHKARTHGQPLKRLRDLTGNPRTPANEVVREDHYYNPYQGREYRTGGAAEVMTMVFQPLLGEMDVWNAQYLKRILERDPAIVRLALGLLFHWKP